MSKRFLVALSAVAILAGGIFAWKHFSSGSEITASPQKSSDEESVELAETGEDAKEKAATHSEVSRPSIDEDSISVASKTQRKNELDAEHEGRMEVLRSYQRFLREANLTTEQKRRLLEVLGDAQVAYWLHQRAVEEDIIAGKTPGKKLANEVATKEIPMMNEQAEQAVASILKPGQMELFKEHLDVEMIAYYRLLDIESDIAERTHARRRSK